MIASGVLYITCSLGLRMLYCYVTTGTVHDLSSGNGDLIVHLTLLEVMYDIVSHRAIHYKATPNSRQLQK